MVAVSEPVVAGLKTSETVQLAPAARVEPQVVDDFRNELASVPVSVTPAASRVTVAELVFSTVMVCAPEVEPTATGPHASLFGLNVNGGAPGPPALPAAPVPESDTVCSAPEAP